MRYNPYSRCRTALLSLLVATGAMAHGADGVHLMGVVKGIETKSLSLETKDKKAVTVHLDEKTLYEKGGSPATAQELQPGERVVVHAKKESGGLRAELVKFGKSSKPASPAPVAHPPGHDGGTAEHGEHHRGSH